MTLTTQEDYYVPRSEYSYSNLPKINGMPLWAAMETTNYGHKTPSFCRFDKMINYPSHLQEPQIGIEGSFGTGKSQLLNLIVLLKLAGGYKGLAFVDQHLEIRNLVTYGYYNKRGDFIPFEFTIWSPKDYEFYDIWGRLDKERNNVTYRIQENGFEDVKEIVEKLDKTPYGMQAVYYDCYDRVERIRLFNAIMEHVGRLRSSREQGYHPVVWMVHELSEILPMLPEGKAFSLAQKATDLFLDFRKQDICTVAAYQMKSEVYYRMSFKWNFIGQKRPVYSRHWQPYQEAARTFGAADVNIVRDGYWMHHQFEPLQELQDKYRLIPQFEKVTLDGEPIAQESVNIFKTHTIKLVKYMYYELDLSQEMIGTIIGVSQPRISQMVA